ncbi:MAG: endonuclease III domain-containing protein, partial [Halococcoides sp.]
MSEDPRSDGDAREEPAHNLARGEAADVRIADPDTRAAQIVDRLGDFYWRTTYGGQNAFRCLVRTILSQNTTDAASQPAFDALLDRYDDGDLVAALAAADTDRLAETIASAGLHNQKADRIQTIAAIVASENGDEEAFDRSVREGDADAVRDRLLDFTGVGPKTADCVLLFAGGEEGVFPV